MKGLAVVSAFGLLVVMSDFANAGPDATTQWLIDDPVSMMDIGILKINMALRFDKKPVAGNASYNWDKNRIEITYYPPLVGSEVEAEKSCAIWISDVRLVSLVSDKNGLPFFGEVSEFALAFSHVGFDRTLMPKDLFKNIDQVIDLRCHGYYDDKTGQAVNKSVQVVSPLLGTGYSIKKE